MYPLTQSSYFINPNISLKRSTETQMYIALISTRNGIYKRMVNIAIRTRGRSEQGRFIGTVNDLGQH